VLTLAAAILLSAVIITPIAHAAATQTTTFSLTDDAAIAAFGYTGDNGQWWTFDDPWSIGRKMAIVKQKNLLGAMIWEMSGDNGSLMTALDAGLA